MWKRAGTPIDEVRRYYDENTLRFERFGHGRATGSIHRAVYGEGVTTRTEALRYLDQLILAEVKPLQAAFAEPLRVLDLGCGVGSTLLYLAEHAPIRGTGVTVSGVQARRAAERIAASGLGDRVRCLEANFVKLPESVGPAELAFSIEAFVHGPDPAAYFAASARHVVPGGRLVLCDDFLAPRAEGDLTRREARALDEVRRCWLAHTLITSERAITLAERAGYRLERNLDLTPRLELRRLRDRMIAAVVLFGRHLPRRGSRLRALIGGNALQQALLSGLIEFRCLVWRREG
jgi:SAM-dependent methyltransferase